MRHAVLVTALLLVVPPQSDAQEEKPSRDSARITVSGCMRGRSLIAVRRPAAEPVGNPVEEGRRFRLSGSKKIVNEIRAQKSQMVEVTGLVRLAQLSPATQGYPIGGGGRIRIGGGPPNRDPTQSDPRRDPLANETQMDVEAWRPLPEACSTRQ